MGYIWSFIFKYILKQIFEIYIYQQLTPCRYKNSQPFVVKNKNINGQAELTENVLQQGWFEKGSLRVFRHKVYKLVIC